MPRHAVRLFPEPADRGPEYTCAKSPRGNEASCLARGMLRLSDYPAIKRTDTARRRFTQEQVGSG